jgi:uncharacterized membrane protein
MAWDQFILDYFINPVYTGEGYNVINTVVYAIGLLIALYALQWGLKKYNIKPNAKFFWAVFPYILIGGLVRALADFMAAIGLPKHWLFITPGIYFLVFGVFVFSFLVARLTKDHVKSLKQMGWAYVALLSALVLFCAWRGFDATSFIAIIAMTATLSVIMWWALGRLGVRTSENIAICAGQMLDASASAIAITFLGYFEQHVVSGAIMDFGSPFLFVPVKMLVALGAVYVIQTQAKEPEWEWLLKIVVLTLGLATGTRDAVRVFLKV